MSLLKAVDPISLNSVLGLNIVYIATAGRCER